MYYVFICSLFRKFFISLTYDFANVLLLANIIQNIRGFKYLFAGIYDFLTLPIFKEYVN